MHGKQAPAVSISNLNVRYQQYLLFDNFCCHFRASKCTCLLGPSGIGKTTILRFVAGLDCGEDTRCFGSVAASDQAQLQGRIAYMDQRDWLLPWLCVLDNILVGFRLRGKSIDKIVTQRAMTLLDRVGLVDVWQKKPHQLSHGMRQRVALVRVLFEDSSVVLMDEPFTALDVVTKAKLQSLAAELLVDRTVLLVTHDPLEALKLADDIYVLNGSPVSASEVIRPAGNPPRNIADPALVLAQTELLKFLAVNPHGDPL